MNFLAGGTRLVDLTCSPSDAIFAAAEKCLDNRLGVCFVVDCDQRLLGRVGLDDIRQAIMDGEALSDFTVGRLMQRSAASAEPAARVAIPVLSDDGRLLDVDVDRSKNFVQVAQPDLSHHEFRAVLDAFLSSWISSKGSYIDAFEREFASFIGMKRGVAVSHGTVALHLALVALGIGPGDEVIVPDLTFAATINAVLYCGATPVIVDVDDMTWTMSLKAVERAWTARTRAIIPVHLYGRPAEIGPIAEFARSREIFVVEDCAEAHGARYAGRMVGGFSDIACFSFYGNKIVTTGEGGMCVTDSEPLAATLLELRSHGMRPERGYWHDRIGFNYRMTNMQAAVGLMQLRRIGLTLERNRDLDHLYREHLSPIPGVRFAPPLPAFYEPVVWLVCTLVPDADRDAVIDAAHRAGIECRPFFHPLSSMPPYRAFARPCPVSSHLARTGLNLPTSGGVDRYVAQKMARVLRDALGA